MSAAARKWLSRQNVEGASPNLILRVLADTADRHGRCDIAQAAIAQRAGLGERTVRDALNTLATAGLIRREHRSAGGKTGRIADLIHLDMRDNAVVQPAESAGNDDGATGNSCRLQTVVQPAESAVAPQIAGNSENSMESTSRARVDVYTTSPDKIQARTSSRVWFEKRYGTWRVRIRLDGVELDLGRFPSEAEATRALEGALADIEHACAYRSGTPRQAIIRLDQLGLTGASLADFLFDGSGPADSRPTTEPPDAGFNLKDSSVCPASLSESASTRARK